MMKENKEETAWQDKKKMCMFGSYLKMEVKWRCLAGVKEEEEEEEEE